MKPREELLRLTVDHQTGNVTINKSGAVKLRVFGRSAYLCPKEPCVTRAQKGGRLHKALEGRKRVKIAKNSENKTQPRLQWPLEPELIKVIADLCTEDGKTCQNTESK
jgi:predicted RNA-binding protein YlxR (DUF448 family)